MRDVNPLCVKLGPSLTIVACVDDGRVLADGPPEQVRQLLGHQINPGAQCHDCA